MSPIYRGFKPDTSEAYYIRAENKELLFNTHLHHALKSTLKNLPPQLEFPEDANSEQIADICCNYLNEFQRFLNGTNLDEPKVHRRMACGVFKSTGIPPEELNFDEHSEEDKKRLFDWLAGERGAQMKLDEYPVDNEDCRKLVPALSLTADSSQHSAVVDAAKGLCFYIEGPPGTGKSQTIVNIISNCLYHNKSVLFLAQKTAALNVVYERLKTVKLDNQCIPLHSDCTNKSQIFDSLGYFMGKFGQTGPLNRKFTDLIKRRDEVIEQLNKYASFLKYTDKKEIDEDCFSNHDIITRFALVKNKVIHGYEFVIPEVYSKSEFDSLKKNLEDLKLDINDTNLDSYKALNFYRNTKPVTTFDLPDLIQKTVELLSKTDGVGELFMGYGEIDIDNEIERISKAIPILSEYNGSLTKLRDLFDQIDTVPHSEINKDCILLRDAGGVKWLFNKEVKECYAKYRNISAEKEQKKKALISDLSAAAQLSKTRDSLHDKLEELSINDFSETQNEKYLIHLKDIKITFEEVHIFFESLNIVDIDYTFNILKEYLSLLSINSNLLHKLSVINSKNIKNYGKSKLL